MQRKERRRGKDRGGKRRGGGEKSAASLKERQKRDTEGRWNDGLQMTDISDGHLVTVLSHSNLAIVWHGGGLNFTEAHGIT